MSTDKSSRLALTTKLMYGEGMQCLVSGDHMSSMEKMALSEEPLYLHSQAMIRIFGLGKINADEQERRAQSLKVTNTGLPGSEGSSKDHNTG